MLLNGEPNHHWGQLPWPGPMIDKSLAGHDDLTDLCKPFLIQTHRAVDTTSWLNVWRWKVCHLDNQSNGTNH